MGYNRHFVFALAIAAVTALVQTVLSLALPLLALDLSGTATGLALIKGAGFVPNILFAIFIGVINDRIAKARAYRTYASAMLLLTAALWTGLATDRISVVALMAFMIGFNALAYAQANAQMTLIRLTVPQDRLSDATALSSGVHAVISTAGPALGGLALMVWGQTGVAAACTVLLLASAMAAFAINPPGDRPNPHPFWPAVRDGWQAFTANRELVVMTTVIVLTNAAEGAFTVGLILKLKTQLLADDFQIGLVLAAAGLGAVLASAVAARWRRALGYRFAFFWPIWGLALLYLLMIPAWPFWVICLLSLIEGFGAIFFAIGIWSRRQETTAAAVMGRVAGITGAIFKIGMPPVIFLAGVLSDAGSITSVFVMAAAINIAAALFLATLGGWGWPRRAAQNLNTA